MKQSFFFFFFLHNYVHGLPFSSERALCTMDGADYYCLSVSVCFLRNEHIGVCHLHCFGSNQKVLYEKPKELDT